MYLGDLDLTADDSPEATKWAADLAGWVFGAGSDWAAEFTTRFGVVDGDTFNYLLETGIEVVQRIHIDPEKGTVMKGQLWTEEALPAESILGALIHADLLPGATVTAEDLFEKYCKSGESYMQMGGKATVGRGRVRVRFC